MPKFDLTVNLGHVLIIITFIAGIGITYMDIVRSLDNHELRVVTLERKADRDYAMQREILNQISALQRDIAAMEAARRRDRDR